MNETFINTNRFFFYMKPNESKAESAVKRLDEIKESASITRITVNPVNQQSRDMSNEAFKIYPDGIDYIARKETVGGDGNTFIGELYVKPSGVLFSYQAKYSNSQE